MSAPLRRTIAAAALAALLALPAGAWADDVATYAVHSCRGPEGAPISTRAWQADPQDQGAADTCATGGALSVGAGGPAPGDGALSAMRFLAPAGTRIAGYRIHLTAAAGPEPEGWWSELEAGLAAGPLVEVGPVTAGCPGAECAFGDEGDPLDDANLVTSSGTPPAGLALVARCGPEPCEAHLGGDTFAVARIWRSVVDVEDPAPPVLGAIGGSLAAAGPVSGRASAAVEAQDAGGGVASVALRIDGVERARLAPGGDCAAPYVVAVPCPASVPASLEVDTRDLADGPHAAVVVATDAAGQVTTSAPLPFNVANAAPPTAPAAGPPLVTFAEPARAAITLDATRFTLPARGKLITGVVRRADGTPAAGAQLVVRSRRFGADAPRPSAETTARAGDDGRFAIPLGALPRRLSLLLDDPRYRSAESDEVQVRGGLAITLRAIGKGLRNGSVLRLDARVLGAGRGAAEGRPVLVQARVGGRWATVDSVEADATGRARWRYRFRNTTRPTLYRFRVQVPRGGLDWPWPTTDSRVVDVLVRP